MSKYGSIIDKSKSTFYYTIPVLGFCILTRKLRRVKTIEQIEEY